MSRGGDNGRRRVVYCVIPRDLAGKLHDLLRVSFGATGEVEVIVERRSADRRVTSDRRLGEASASRRLERRRIRNLTGRRIGERRAPLVAVDIPMKLPRRARPHEGRLVFLERLEPSGEALEDLDTGRLVTRIQAGDSEEFAPLYMRYFDRVYSYLRVILRDEHQAEDATQQVFMKVLEALPRYERRSQPFSAWLFVIARNQAFADLHVSRRAEVTDPTHLGNRDATPGPEEFDIGPLDWISDRELLLFVERLPLAQRQALVLRYMLDLPSAEVATVMGRSPDDVRMLQSRALRFLRKRLAAVGRGPVRKGPARMRAPLRKSRVLRGRRFALSYDARRAPPALRR